MTRASVSLGREDELKFRRMWRDGVAAEEMGSAFEISSSSVSKLALRMGLPQRRFDKNRDALVGGKWERRGHTKVWVDDVTFSK